MQGPDVYLAPVTRRRSKRMITSEYNGKVLPTLPLPELIQRIIDCGTALYSQSLVQANMKSIERFAKALSIYGGKTDNTWTSYGCRFVQTIHPANLGYVVPENILAPANEWQGEMVQLKREYNKPYKKWLLRFWFGDDSMESEAVACLNKLPDCLRVKSVEPYMAKEECLMARFDETKWAYPIPVSFLECVLKKGVDVA